MSSVRRPPPALSDWEVNRERFTDEALAPYEGQWVAFSRDCKRIVASAPDLLELDQRVISAGEDPNHVCLEFVPVASDETWPGGAEFG
jgi:hypothetical protein